MLSPKAEQVIYDYLNLPFKNSAGIRCPYYNNSRNRERGQLRVLIGKGLPQDIVDEAQIISIQYHAGLINRNGECHTKECGEASIESIRKFLIDYNLGIECSGFVTHVLNAHYKETKGFALTSKMRIVQKRHLLRWIISRLRPVENISVRTYADTCNSKRILGEDIGYNYSAVQPGDIVVMLETGPNNKRNHILVVTNTTENTIEYAHARAWSSEGQYGHGVARGTITITKPTASLIAQEWTELGVTSEKNETLWEARQAKSLDIRRLNF